MLKQLHIRNFALFGQLDVEFGPGLNVLTGETGAGKSMLIGAMELIFGKRADTSLLFHKEEKSVVESRFGGIQAALKKALLKLDAFDVDADELLIRREISAAGKSRAFINDTPVSLQVLRSAAELLVDLHGQHENQSLLSPQNQLETLDEWSGSVETAAAFASRFREWKNCSERLAELRMKESELKRQAEFFRFQAEELKAAKLDLSKDAGLEAELQKLENAEAFRALGSEAENELYSDDRSLYNRISQYAQRMEKTGFPPSILAALRESADQLRNAGMEIMDFLESLEADPRRLAKMQERSDLLNRLKIKFGARELEDLLRMRDELDEKAGRGESLDEEIARLENEKRRLEQALEPAALELEKLRLAGAKSLEKSVRGLLPEVALDKAEFRIECIRRKSAEEFLETNQGKLHISSSGCNEVRFLVSANPGIPPAPLQHAASGGEISRVMLALKTALAGKEGVSTLIFDEIDTGISGATAMKVASVMRKTAKTKQIIAITHLPQIAAAGEVHFRISKIQKGKSTLSQIEKLDLNARSLALAVMLSGENPSSTALKNAGELMEAFQSR